MSTFRQTPSPPLPSTFFCALLAGILGLVGCQANSGNSVVSRDTITIDVARNSEIARTRTAEGFELIQQKKYQEAETALKTAIDADTLYGPAHNDLGLVDYRLDRLYEAAWQLENAIKLMPNRPEPRNNLGLVLEKGGKLSDAMENYSTASRMDPPNPEYLGNLARVRLRLDLRDEETCRVLEALIARETRPQWLDWARFNLIRIKGAKIETQPATEPAG